MFLAHPPGRAPVSVSEEGDADAASWLDLLNPTDEERALAARITGLRMPTREEIEEIENSSRVYIEGDTFYLSTPLVRRIEDRCFTSPVGFVLSRDRLVTLRYSEFSVFELVSQRLAAHDAPFGPEEELVLLLEAVTDRIADLLEYSGRELDQMSKQIFHSTQQRAKDPDRMLRTQLQLVGRQADLISAARDSLLGMQRIVVYVSENNDEHRRQRFATRLDALARDVSSLSDYDVQMTNKVQFLLDATLGFINIEQNNGIRVLTVVSIIGVPPTLIASIYGMNFKNIPELNWSFGYYYALSLMTATIVLPLIWFWRRGWLGGR